MKVVLTLCSFYWKGNVMKSWILSALCVAGLHMPLSAYATTTATAAAMPLCGQGVFKFFGFSVYDAKLYGTCHGSELFNHPFTLELTYLRSFTRKQLVDSSLDEMTRLQAIPNSDVKQRWSLEMGKAFSDVVPGDTFKGEYLPGQGARFYLNGQLTSSVNAPEFARHFFDIWFDRETRAPGLRAQLLGEGR